MIEPGDPLPLGIDVYNALGVLADGGAVALTLTLPDQTSLSSPGAITIAHPATGQYTASVIATQVGQYRAVWTVTGANAGVKTDAYQVEQPDTGIVSLDEAKAHLRIRRSDDDETIRSLILAASDACESAEGTNRVWRRTVVTGELQTGGECSIQLCKAPVLSITTLTVDGATQTVADYDISATSGRIYATAGSWAYSGRRNNIVVSYVAGQTTPVPAMVRDGVLEMVRHLYGIHRGGSAIPRQEEPDFTQSAGYLIPNRVTLAWRAHRSAGL